MSVSQHPAVEEVLGAAGERPGAARRSDLRRARRSLIGCVVFGCAAVVLTLWFAMDPGERALPSPLAATGLALLVAGGHFALVFRRSSAVDPVIWIPVAMLLFYFGMPVALEVLGSGPIVSYDSWDVGTPRSLNRGYLAALVTLVAFVAGVHLCGLRPTGGRPAPSGPEVSRLFLPSLTVALGGVAMMLIGIAIVGPATLFGSYAQVWEAKASGLDVRLLEVGFMFSQGATYGLLASYSPRQRLTRLVPLAVAGWLVLYSILTGDRAAMFSFGFAAAWVFSQRIRRVPWKAMLVAGLIGIFAIPIIKEFREYGDVETSLQVSPLGLVSATLYEMGSTAQVFGHTLDYIPGLEPYRYGSSWLYAAASLVPNPGLEQGKSFLPDPKVHLPSTWLTRRLNPIKAELGGGYGNAIGAEWYFNFGPLGLLFGMMATGYALAAMRNRANRSSIALMLSASFYSLVVLTVRNSLSAPLKAVLWPVIGVLVLLVIFSRLGLLPRLPSRGPAPLGRT